MSTAANSSGNDKPFGGSIPRFYEKYLVPLIFEPYAEDIAPRVARLGGATVLETAAGTGVVTRRLSSLLPPGVSIVATDVSQPMLDLAIEIGTGRPVKWRQADAMALPFEDGSFDTVVCQFGIMFFADRIRAINEARRVLRPGGTFLFNVWDRIEENEFVDTVVTAVGRMFPADPPRFMAQTPHGYHDRDVIAGDLARGGFRRVPAFETVIARSRADSAMAVALAYCQGTPLRTELEARAPSRLQEATELAERAIEERFGSGPVAAKIQAHVVAVS